MKLMLSAKTLPTITTFTLAIIASLIIISSLKLTFGILVFILGILFSLNHPFFLIWIMFFSFILWPYVEYYTKIQLPLGIVFIFMFIIYYVVNFLKSLSKTQNHLNFTLVDLISIALIFIGLILFLISDDKYFALIGLKENFKMCFLFLFIRAIRPNEKDIHNFLSIFLIIAIVVSLYGIYQYFFNYYWLINKVGGISDISEKYLGLSTTLKGHLGTKRAYSLFLNSFTLAYYLMISLLIIEVRVRRKVLNNADRFFLISSPILIFCFILTFARSAWVGFVIGSIVLLLVNKNWYAYKRYFSIMLLTVIFGVIILIFIPKQLQNTILERMLSIFSYDIHQTSAHYEFLRKDIALTIKHPLGIGLGKATAYIGEVWNESSFFKLTTEMGLIPGLLYVSIFVLSFHKGLKLYKKVAEPQKELILITLGVTAAYFVSGFVFPVWMTWFPTMVLWILMASLFNIGDDYEKGIINNNC